MTATYTTLAEFAQTWGLVYFVAIFLVVARLRAVAVAQAASSTRPPAFRCGRTDTMADDSKRTIDAVTGTATTGHEWDGIRELNTPLPRWWLWLFYATIVWSIGYWIVYPSWPLLSGYTQGVFGWHSRERGRRRSRRAASAARRRWSTSSPRPRSQEIVADPQLLRLRARAGPRRPSRDNCAPCHGAGGGGAKGYPNLNDDDWLWGGTLDEIAQTIRHGIRSGRRRRPGPAAMPAFGRDGMLKRADDRRRSPTTCARSPACRSRPRPISPRGKKVFADNCAACHGDDRQGQSRARRART